MGGDLSKYINDDVLNRYEVIYREGHLRIMKNNEKINRLFMEPKGLFTYKQCFSVNDHYGFDEALSFQRIIEKSDVRAYINDNDVADIDAFQFPMRIRRVEEPRWKGEAGIFRSVHNYSNQIFAWKNGKILRYFVNGGKVGIDEFMYIHLMQRKISTQLNDSCAENAFVITSDSFIPYPKEMSTDFIMKHANNTGTVKEKVLHKIIRKLKVILHNSPRRNWIAVQWHYYYLFEKIKRRN